MPQAIRVPIRTPSRDLVIVNVFRGIADHFSERVVSWVMAGMLMNTGLVVLGSPESFNAQPAYRLMQCVGDARQWGAICVAIGFLRIVALIVNGTFAGFHGLTAHARVLLSTFSSLVWLQLAVGTYTSMADGHLGVVFYPFLVFLEVHNAVVAAREAGAVERVACEQRRCRTTIQFGEDG